MTPWHIRQRVKEWLRKRFNRADAKRAIDRHGRPVETGSILHTEKSHRRWYILGRMGKQRGKPHYAPPKERKSGKTWKHQ